VALVCYWLLSGRSRELPRRRMLAVAGLIALSGALNGWFLIPDVSYGYDTLISAFASTAAREGLGPKSVFASEFFNTFGVIFNPLREVQAHPRRRRSTLRLRCWRSSGAWSRRARVALSAFACRPHNGADRARGLLVLIMSPVPFHGGCVVIDSNSL